MPYVGQKPADIISTAVDTVTGKFSGEVDAASLDISGNIDVDGTTNLDVVDIDGAVDMASTLIVAGKVGIGISDPAPYDDGGDRLVIGDTTARSGMTIVSSTSTAGSVHFADGTGNTSYRGILAYYHDNDSMRFSTSAAEQVRIHSNGVLSASDGIALGVGTANTASNVLDDYEEGTWTPVFNNGGTTAFGTNGYSLGTYTKVGRLVNCQFRMSAGTMSNSDASAQLSISGLPFTVLNTTNQYSATVLYGISINLPSGYSYFAGQHAIGGTNLTLSPGGDNVGEVGLKANALTANTTQIRGSFTFFAA